MNRDRYFDAPCMRDNDLREKFMDRLRGQENSLRTNGRNGVCISTERQTFQFDPRAWGHLYGRMQLQEIKQRKKGMGSLRKQTSRKT